MSRLFVAEREGFEPSRALGALHDFQSCALDQLSHLSKAVRQIRTARAIIAINRQDVKPFYKKELPKSDGKYREKFFPLWSKKIGRIAKKSDFA